MKTFDMIIKEIAKKEGISPETVYDEMQKAIDAGFDSTDPQVAYSAERVRRDR